MSPATDNDNNSGAAYFTGQAAPAGSALYYACLLTEPAIRPQALAWHTLEHELVKSLTEVQDPGVARLRLQWWAEELDRSSRSEARHPLGQALQPILQASDIAVSELEAAISALQDAIGLTDRDDYEELRAEYTRLYGPLWRLSARLAGIGDETALAASAELGGLHHMQRALLELPQTLARGLSRPIPRNELDAAGVGQDDRLTEPAWHSLLDDQFQRLQHSLTAAWPAFPAAAAPAFLHGLILIRLDAALTAEIRRDGCQLQSRRYALTPIRRLWLAWRTRRRVLRG